MIKYGGKVREHFLWQEQKAASLEHSQSLQIASESQGCDLLLPLTIKFQCDIRIFEFSHIYFA